MSERMGDQESYEAIIRLQERIINMLVEALQRFIDCEKLPCFKLICEAAELRADMLRE